MGFFTCVQLHMSVVILNEKHGHCDLYKNVLIFIWGIIKICFFSLNGNNYLKQLWNY